MRSRCHDGIWNQSRVRYAWTPTAVSNRSVTMGTVSENAWVVVIGVTDATMIVRTVETTATIMLPTQANIKHPHTTLSHMKHQDNSRRERRCITTRGERNPLKGVFSMDNTRVFKRTASKPMHGHRQQALSAYALSLFARPRATESTYSSSVGAYGRAITS